MNSQFGERIRTFRDKQNLYLQQVAPLIEMDTAQLSKIEKGLRQLKREQVPIIADLLKANSDDLVTLFFADQFYSIFEVKLKIMSLVIKKLGYSSEIEL
ncbi:MAG: helix-turn-helix domain-containing protein [Saprospiraceae bacterium]|nr:helix-turn-helix domain-containing protein [Candidatus Defluviibacterium haderslevense]